MIADHAQPGRTFAERLAIPGRLADQEVARQQDEAENDFDQERQRARPRDAAERHGKDGDRNQDHRDDQRIQDLRQEAAPDPGDLVLERHPLRRRDDEIV